MAGSTTRYLLRKPDPTDTVNVTTDLSDPYDIIDSNLARVDDAVLANEITSWTRVVSSAGTYLSTSAGTELDLPKLAVENITTIKNNRVYNFKGRLYLTSPTANDDFQIRVRKDTALSGTELSLTSGFIDVTNLDHVLFFGGSWKATADDTDGDFYVSIQRVSGGGVANIRGDRMSQFKMWVEPPNTSNYVES